MQQSDPEDLLRKAAFNHLTSDELVAYRDNKLDTIGLARADAHLRLCLICEESVELLRGEIAALENREITPEQIAIVRRVITQARESELLGKSSPADETPKAPFVERLTDYLDQLRASWEMQFSRALVYRSTEPDDEVWRWKSDDGAFQGRAIQEGTGDLTIQLSSVDPEAEGVRLNVHLGNITHEITMQRLSKSGFGADIKVPRHQPPGKLSNIFIERI